MTKQELELFEKRLQERGYKKCSAHNSADYAWYKSFGKSVRTKYRSNYQIAFSIYDFSPYVDRDCTLAKNPYRCHPTILLSRTVNERVDVDFTTQYYRTDIDKIESLAESFLQWAEKNVEIDGQSNKI